MECRYLHSGACVSGAGCRLKQRVATVARTGAFLAALSLILFALVLVAGLNWRRDLIYPFDATPFAPQHVGLPRSDVFTVRDGDGPDLPVWRVTPHPGKPTIVYFMGNVGNLGRNGPRIQEFAVRGYGLIAMTYRGGGGVPGAPSEAVLKHDALRVWRAVRAGAPDTRHVIYGTSLGAGIATWLAAEVADETALVLETPFTRLCDAVRAAWPVLPACTVMWDERYGSIDLIDRIGVPVLILHGDADQVIPVAQGRALFAAAPGPKEMIIYPGGRHNDLRLYGAGVDALAWIDAL